MPLYARMFRNALQTQKADRLIRLFAWMLCAPSLLGFAGEPRGLVNPEWICSESKNNLFPPPQEEKTLLLAETIYGDLKFELLFFSPLDVFVYGCFRSSETSETWCSCPCVPVWYTVPLFFRRVIDKLAFFFFERLGE